FDQTELNVVHGKRPLQGAIMEPFDSLRSGQSVISGQRYLAATPAEVDVPAIGDLPQIFVQGATKICQLGVATVQADGSGFAVACLRTHAWSSSVAGVAVSSFMTSRPRRELVMV